MTTSIADIKRVLVDTSAWIDLMNSKERQEPGPHDAAYHQLGNCV